MTSEKSQKLVESRFNKPWPERSALERAQGLAKAKSHQAVAKTETCCICIAEGKTKTEAKIHKMEMYRQSGKWYGHDECIARLAPRPATVRDAAKSTRGRPRKVTSPTYVQSEPADEAAPAMSLHSDLTLKEILRSILNNELRGKPVMIPSGVLADLLGSEQHATTTGVR